MDVVSATVGVRESVLGAARCGSALLPGWQVLPDLQEGWSTRETPRGLELRSLVAAPYERVRVDVVPGRDQWLLDLVLRTARPTHGSMSVVSVPLASGPSGLRALAVDDPTEGLHVIGRASVPGSAHSLWVSADGAGVRLRRADAGATDLVLLDVNLPVVGARRPAELLRRLRVRVHAI